MHPTSLPGPYGIGDLGRLAYRWVDALARAQQTWWQMLPLGPTGYGDSPYQCFSAFAGNPYLVSPDLLIEDGLLKASDVTGLNFPAHKVDYGPVIEFKVALVSKAWEAFKAGKGTHLRAEFDAFCVQEAAWLDDYGLFMALKDAHNGRSWLEWGDDLRMRQPVAMTGARETHADRVGQHKFRQFLFFRQWSQLKAYANQHGIKLIGDAPIFVSADSADVWANPELFLLDEARRPSVVAGVPPDYFSATGQLWGNPLYNWPAHKASGYTWWAARMRAIYQQVDMVRLDHFRGFEANWEIKAGMPTAEIGHWVKGPGAELFQALKDQLGQLNIIAEDLGIITPEVDALRTGFGLPGMRILQFAFGGATEDRFLPHSYETTNTVVYTGTHDNDTTLGWYQSITDKERDFVRRYLARDGKDIVWDLIRSAWSSVADYAIVPAQDILNLGGEARMNRPGIPGGNWAWRLTDTMPLKVSLERLQEMTELYGRSRVKPKAAVSPAV